MSKQGFETSKITLSAISDPSISQATSRLVIEFITQTRLHALFLYWTIDYSVMLFLLCWILVSLSLSTMRRSEVGFCFSLHWMFSHIDPWNLDWATTINQSLQIIENHQQYLSQLLINIFNSCDIVIKLSANNIEATTFIGIAICFKDAVNPHLNCHGFNV